MPVIVPGVLPGWAGHMAPPNGVMHLVSVFQHALFGWFLGTMYAAWHRGRSAGEQAGLA